MEWTKTLPVVVGALGFLISLFNLWRAAKTSNEVRSITYAQNKQNLLTAIQNGEASYLGVKVQAQDLLWEAEDTKLQDAAHAVGQASFLIDHCESALKLLGESREALDAANASNRSHADLIHLLETHASAVSEYTNKSKIEAEAAALLQPARRLLKLIARA